MMIDMVVLVIVQLAAADRSVSELQTSLSACEAKLTSAARESTSKVMALTARLSKAETELEEEARRKADMATTTALLTQQVRPCLRLSVSPSQWLTPLALFYLLSLSHAHTLSFSLLCSLSLTLSLPLLCSLPLFACRRDVIEAPSVMVFDCASRCLLWSRV
jgi:hypothetical protein